MRRILLLIALHFFTTVKIYAQCPVITCPSSATISCNTPTLVTATSNYSSNITSRWIGPGGLPLNSIGTATSVANLNHKGTYTVEFKDNLSNCISSETLNIVITNTAINSDYAIFDIAASSFTQSCSNSLLSFTFTYGNTYPIPGGALNNTIVPLGNPMTPNLFSNAYIFTLNTCGQYVFGSYSGSSGCLSSYTVSIGCPTLSSTSLSVTPNSTVCIGSSQTLTASGASSYTWSTGTLNASVVITPNATTIYTVSGDSPISCIDTKTVSISVNSLCAMVWPGDANSDGVVDNTDIFELGFAYNNIGASRTPGGNAYSSQYSSNWTGTITNGKNKNHADCNGDGIINLNDTVSIFNNYLLTHSFKPTETSSNPEIYLLSSENHAFTGQWNSVDIMLGDETTIFNQLYGVAFEIDFDKNIIEPNSAYVIYNASFLNFSNQNIEFRKPDFTNGKIYGASVRTNGNEVNGAGKIGEFWYKLKTDLIDQSSLNLSISNAKKTGKTGVNTNLTGGNILITTLVTDMDELKAFNNSIYLYPNPVSDKLFVKAVSKNLSSYVISDIMGREIKKGEFIGTIELDVSTLNSGTYIFQTRSGSLQAYKKLVIE